MRDTNGGLRGKTVLLVDDLTASGSTLDEASKVLKKMGARRAIAKSRHFKVMWDLIEQ